MLHVSAGEIDCSLISYHNSRFFFFFEDGYTSATFSGRSAMPLLADAIVECGRRTLRNAIKLANDWGADKQGKWFGATVVYGEYVFLFFLIIFEFLT